MANEADRPGAAQWEELDDASYTRLRRDLLRTKGSALQRGFLEALQSRDGFGAWMKKRVEVKDGDKLPLLDNPLTEDEFINPPPDTEEGIHAAWRGVSPAQASRASFWGLAALRHIENRRIDPGHLAVQEGKGDNGRGLAYIALVLRQGERKKIDSAVRTVLRRMSGLPEARGVRSVYTDCPFARAWWRRRLAEEIARETGGADRADILGVLKRSKAYWEQLIMLVVSSNSVLGDARVRTALVWALSEANQEQPDALFTKPGLNRIHRAIGIRLAWQELGVLPVEEIKTLLAKDFLPLAADRTESAPAQGSQNPAKG